MRPHPARADGRRRLPRLLPHRRRPGHPADQLHIQVDFYANTDWSWVTTPATATGSFTARIKVPSGTPYGLYDGAIVVSGNDQDDSSRSPSPSPRGRPGRRRQPHRGAELRRRGRRRRAAQPALQQRLGVRRQGLGLACRVRRLALLLLRRAEDAAAPAPCSWPTRPGTTGAVHRPRHAGVRPVENSYQLADGTDPIFAPYVLGTVGGSPNTNIGAGVWAFDTATGGPEELVTAPVQEGLHAIVQHEVDWQTAASSNCRSRRNVGERAPSHPTSGRRQTTAADSGSFDVTFKAASTSPGWRRRPSASASRA